MMLERFADAKLHATKISDLFFLFLTSIEAIINAQDHPWMAY